MKRYLGAVCDAITLGGLVVGCGGGDGVNDGVVIQPAMNDACEHVELPNPSGSEIARSELGKVSGESCSGQATQGDKSWGFECTGGHCQCYFNGEEQCTCESDELCPGSCCPGVQWN